MKIILFLLLFAAVNPLYSQPTADEFESFLGFEGKCPVETHDIAPKKDGPFGEVVWLKGYVPAKSLYRYVIGVSKKGTLFKEDRAKIEQDVRNRPSDLRRSGQDSFLYKEVIKTELGEEFFTIDSISREMTSMIGFITVGNDDIFVIEYALSITQWRKNNPEQNPLTPKKRLPEVLDYIARQPNKP